MSVVLNPYLTFQNQTKEAMEFYHSIFGGELKMTTFGEGMPEGYKDEGDKGLIMHAVIVNGPLTFMASDGGKMHEVHVGDNMSMSLSGDDDEALSDYFNKLSEGGKVNMHLEKAPWGDKFGMLTDKFGINWMVNISGMQNNTQGS